MKTSGELFVEWERLEKEAQTLYSIWAQHEEDDRAAWKAFRAYEKAFEKEREAFKKYQEACIREEGSST